MEHEKDNLKQEAETAKPEEAKTAAAEEAAPEAAAAAEKEPVKDDKKKKKKDLKDALAQKDAELADQKDQHLRLMAEYQNYRNRTAEEKKKIYGDAKVDCVKELLNVMDSFERALEAPCADENYKKGVELTFAQIQKAFEKLMAGKTSFIIAHRLSTIKSADWILVMNQGNVLEQGTHDSLMEQKGFYANLYQSQFADSETTE